MKTFLALFIARSKEFYRDKGSLAWAIIFPVMAIIGCYFAFSNDNEVLFKIGLYQNPSATNTMNIADHKELNFLLQDYNEFIVYTDLDKALQRVQHHQLHMLIDPSKKRYWMNSKSSQAKVLQDLFKSHPVNYQQQTTQGKAVRYVDWVLPGILGMNIMFGAIFGVGYVIVRYRKNGVLRRLKATPINALQFLSAQVFSRLIIILIANMGIFIGAINLLDLKMFGSYFDLFIVACIGAASMISIGLLIATRTDSEELAGGLLNLITWPMMFLSSVWFSLDAAPSWLQTLSQFFPLTHLVTASRDIMLNGTPLHELYYELFSMTLMTVVFILLGAYLFRWTKE